MRQIAGFLARRVVCRLVEGQRVVQGEKFGLIKFSSRVDVYFGANAAPNVRVGDRVRGGESVIARFRTF